MMKLPNNRIVFTLLILAFLLITAVMPDGAVVTGNCTKSYNIVLELNQAGASVQAVQLVYGYSPLPEAKSGDLKGVITVAGGQTLKEFYLYDPRNQFGDEIIVDQNGTVISSRGIHKRESTAVMPVRFRQEAGAVSFSLYDNKGTLLKTVDLTKAEDRTNWNCTPDYGIVHKSQPGIPLPLILGGAGVLVVGAIAGWFLLKKKNEKSGK